MDKLTQLIYKDGIFSDYFEDYDDKECIKYFTAELTFNFNNTFYKSVITDRYYNPNSYKKSLILKMINNIIYDLGKQKLNEIF